MLRRLSYIIPMLLMFSTATVYAQLDQDEQRSSLAEIERFGLVVDVESTGGFAADPALDGQALRARMAERLEALTGTSPSANPLEKGAPYVYVHFNVLDMGDGLVPFAVNISFIQDARIASGGSRMMSVTWETGSVGLVSYDRLTVIAETADALIAEFAEDLVESGGGS